MFTPLTRGPATQAVEDIEIHEDGQPVITWGNVKERDRQNLVTLCVKARAEGRKLHIYHVYRSWMDVDAMIDEAIAKAQAKPSNPAPLP